MNSVFEGCSSLTSIDLSKFNTERVTTMNRLFSGCTSLSYIDLSGFESVVCTDFSSMFDSCSKLTVKINENQNKKIVELLPSGSTVNPKNILNKLFYIKLNN